MTNIFVVSHRPDKYTKRCVASLIKTSTFPFTINMVRRTAYAAHNKNFVLDLNTADQFIMVNDDIEFLQKGWDQMLLETLNYSPEITVAACRVKLPKNCYEPLSLLAPRDCIIENIRMPDCAIAMRRTNIRFDENYIHSQCDDIDFMLQNIDARYRVVIDTRITINHMKVPCAVNGKILRKNLKVALSKWGNRYKTWGQDTRQFKVLKRY